MALKDKVARAAYAKKAQALARKRKREWLKTLKTDLQCRVCGEKRIVCLDFHHRDPKEKEEQINQLLYRASKTRLLAEIAKCDCLCANCHRVEHEKE